MSTQKVGVAYSVGVPGEKTHKARAYLVLGYSREALFKFNPCRYLMGKFCPDLFFPHFSPKNFLSIFFSFQVFLKEMLKKTSVKIQEEILKNKKLGGGGWRWPGQNFTHRYLGVNYFLSQYKYFIRYFLAILI